jgi:hypothetical protein
MELKISKDIALVLLPFDEDPSVLLAPTAPDKPLMAKQDNCIILY